MLTAFAALLYVCTPIITFNPFSTRFFHPRVKVLLIVLLTLSLLGSSTHVC